MLFICGQSFISGGEQALKDLISNLHTDDKCYLICKDTPEITSFFENSNAELIPFSFFVPLAQLKKYGPASYLIKFLNLAIFLFFLAATIIKTKPKIIISNNFSEIPGSLIAAIFRVPFLQFVHEILDLKSKTAKTITLFDKFISQFVCVSKASKEVLDELITNKQKNLVLYNATEVNAQNFAKHISNPISLVFIGMINNNKNPMRFVRWVKSLSRKRPITASIAYHIADQNTLIEVKDFCASKDIKINWLYNLSKVEISDLIKNSTFSCISSNKEAFSLVALQSISLGTPVLTSNNGGGPEVIDHGTAGIIINSDNDIEETIAPWLEDDAYYQLSENCLRRAQLFSHEERINEFNRIVKKVLLS